MSQRSRNRGRDWVWNEYYSKHLNGDAATFNSNPAGERTAILQRMYMRVLTELAVNRFKWENMPDSVDVRFLEMKLFYRALAVFFFDDDYNKYFAMAGNPASSVNMFENPTRFFVYGNGYEGRYLNAYNRTTINDEGKPETAYLECVPIWSNYLRVPDLDIVMVYASKFAELDTTIEINSKNARRGKVIAVDENQRLTARNIVAQIDQGSPLLEVTPNAMALMPTALDLGVEPDSIEKLHILKIRLWNECMTLLGIDNANQDKKERLVANEVDANNDQVQASRAVSLNARQQAAKAINKRYGLNIKVSYSTDITVQMESSLTGDFIDPASVMSEVGNQEEV